MMTSPIHNLRSRSDDLGLAPSTSTSATSHSPVPAVARTLGSTLLVVACIFVSGCASKPVGSVGYDAFLAESVATVLSGPTPLADASRCFEERGKFLPLSEFSRDSQAGTFTYRLRVSGLWFEQIRLSAQGAGSRAETRLASNLDARWQATFERDRTRALNQCLGN